MENGGPFFYQGSIKGSSLRSLSLCLWHDRGLYTGEARLSLFRDQIYSYEILGSYLPPTIELDLSNPSALPPVPRELTLAVCEFRNESLVGGYHIDSMRHGTVRLLRHEMDLETWREMYNYSVQPTLAR